MGGRLRGRQVAENRQFEKGPVRSGWSTAQRAAVIDELDLIVAHTAFKGSHRCVELLRYLVHHAVTDDQNAIKERTLGVEVFGRDANYDVNADPIVRRTANEIRKRLAQCYLETDRPHAVRIHLERGGYLPRFEFEAEEERLESIEPEKPEPLLEQDKKQSGFAPFLKGFWTNGSAVRVQWLSGIAVALLVIAASVMLLRYRALPHSPQYRVWEPLLESGKSITVCVSDGNPLESGGSGSSQTENSNLASSQNSGIASSQVASVSSLRNSTPSTPFADEHVAHAVITRLMEFQTGTDLRASSQLTLGDFRRRPAVLIGGLNNPWVPILIADLRFSIQLEPGSQDRWIRDAQNPAKRDWKIKGGLNGAGNAIDYAIVTRFFDRVTGQWIVALSGLGEHGTDAAGELLTDPAFDKLIPANIRSAANFQIVLGTSVIRGDTGPIQILAVNSW